MAWRYIAQRIAGPSKGTFLDWNLPLGDVELTNGVGTNWLTGTIDPQIVFPLASDGLPLLDKWSTAIWAEEDGQIRGGGILVENVFTGPSRKIDCMGYSGYPHGIPMVDSYSNVNVDPMTVIQMIWDRLQAFPSGDLDLSVTCNGSPVRMGKSGVGAYQQVYLGGVWRNRADVDPSTVEPDARSTLSAPMTIGTTSLTIAAIDKFNQIAVPFNIVVGGETITVRARSSLAMTQLIRGVGTSIPSTHGKGAAVKYTGTPIRNIDVVPAEPYLLNWWEVPDCGTTIDTLSQLAPCESQENHAWSDTLTNVIDHTLEFRHPRIGKRRPDLRFVLGENIQSMPSGSDEGMYFANSVIGLGAGTGRTMVRVGVSLVDHRLRRVTVLTDKSTTNYDVLAFKSRAELNKHSNTLSISTITVINHPNAEIGTWQAGDEIFIQADLGWTQVAQWCRILSTKIRPKRGNEAELTLEGLVS